MPVELVARGTVARGTVARGNVAQGFVVHPALRRGGAAIFVVQLVAIVAVAGLAIALASLPGSSIAGSAQEVVAGP